MSDEIEAERLIDGWFGVVRVRYPLPSGELDERNVVDHPSGAAVLPYDPDRRVGLVVSEPRPPLLWKGRAGIVEAIGGALDGDDPETCARREAEEEAGVRLSTLARVFHGWVTPATSTEEVTYFLAPYRAGDRIGPGGGLPEEHESIRVRERPLAELWTAVERCEVADVKLLALLQALRLREPALFEA